MYVDPSGYGRAPGKQRADYATGDTPQAVNDAVNDVNVGDKNYGLCILNGTNSNDTSAIAILKEIGLDGIWYKNQRPDFTPVSMFNVEIENMSSNRQSAGGNYDQTRAAIADKIIEANGNINVLINNGVVDQYATAKTKKTVQSFLRSDDVQRILSSNVSNDLKKVALKQSIADFQSEKKYTIHEVDTKKTQLVPTEINGRFNHDGGVSDSKQCGK